MAGRQRSTRLTVPEGHSAAELHSHTLFSDGMVSAEELVRAAAGIGLAVLCITDHDVIGDLAAAVELGRELGVDVVRGQEITCEFPPGIHVVGLFLEQPVRMHMSLQDTVDAIHDQGGLAVMAHPFMPTWFASVTPDALQKLLQSRTIDGIELRHTAPMLWRGWRTLDHFFGAHRSSIRAALGAGDSHFGRHDLGRVVTVFPGRTAEDLRHAIEHGTTSPARGVTPEPPSLSQRLAQQRRSMIWLNGQRRKGLVGNGVGPKPRRPAAPGIDTPGA